MIPRIFHHIWFGSDELPDAVNRMRATWTKHHPEWELRLWHEKDLPWLRNLSLVQRASSYAQKADIARYEVVERYGGVYLDTDMECLRSIDDLVGGLEFFAGRQQWGMINNCIFGAIPGHPILRESIACLPASCLSYRKSGISFQTGPGLLTRVVKSGDWERDAGVRIFPSPFFFPYHVTEPWRRGESFPTAYAVHRWSHSWGADDGVRATWSDLVLTSLHDVRVTSRFVVGSWTERTKMSAGTRFVLPAKRVVKRCVEEAAGVFPRPLQSVPFGSDKLLVRGPLGTRILCSVNDLSLTPELAIDGIYDPSFVEFLKRALMPGMTFVDVGANVGLFTLVGARLVGEGGRVVSYECNPVLLELLRQNVAMNWMDKQVIVVPKAADRSAGNRSFFAPVDMAMLGSLRLPLSGRTSRPGSSTIEVTSERLDDGLSPFPFIDLVKIDVEGGEADVLDGMDSLLSARRVGMISLEYRLDAIDDSQRVVMEKQLTRLSAKREATFHVAGRRSALELDEVLTTAHFAQLIVRFPFSSIPLSAIA